MLVKYKCKKCEKEGFFDIGDLSNIEAMAELKKQFGNGFECRLGNHYEIGSIFNYYEIDWNNPVEGEAMSEEQFLQGLKETFLEVYSTAQLQERYNVEGFLSGQCLVSEKENEDIQKIMLYYSSPLGKRYYVYGLRE